MNDKLKYIYSGKIPIREIDQHFLIRNAEVTSQGQLGAKTIDLASCLEVPHQLGAAEEGDFRDKEAYHKHVEDLESDRKKMKLL